MKDELKLAGDEVVGNPILAVKKWRVIHAPEGIVDKVSQN